MKINNVELEDLDIFDFEVSENIEKAIEKAMIDIKELDSNSKYMKNSQLIKDTCKAIYDCFDTIFGIGTHEKVFGYRINLINAVHGFNDLKNRMIEQKKEQENELQTMISESDELLKDIK